MHSLPISLQEREKNKPRNTVGFQFLSASEDKTCFHFCIFVAPAGVQHERSGGAACMCTQQSTEC